MVTNTHFSVSVSLYRVVCCSYTCHACGCWPQLLLHPCTYYVCMYVCTNVVSMCTFYRIKWTDCCFVGYKSADTCQMEAATTAIALFITDFANQRTVVYILLRSVGTFYLAEALNLCCEYSFEKCVANAIDFVLLPFFRITWGWFFVLGATLSCCPHNFASRASSFFSHLMMALTTTLRYVVVMRDELLLFAGK